MKTSEKLKMCWLVALDLSLLSFLSWFLTIVIGQAKTLHTPFKVTGAAHRVFWTVLLVTHLTVIPRGFEAEVFTGWTLFQSPNRVKELKSMNTKN